MEHQPHRNETQLIGQSLFVICKPFLANDDTKLIRALLSDTSLTLSLGLETTTIEAKLEYTKWFSLSPQSDVISHTNFASGLLSGERLGNISVDVEVIKASVRQVRDRHVERYKRDLGQQVSSRRKRASVYDDQARQRWGLTFPSS